MIGFQEIAIPLIGLLLIRSLIRFLRGGTRRAGDLLAALVWTVALLAILRPDFTTVVARALGVGRGADLVLYLTALAVILSFFFFYRRYRKLNTEVTQLVRELALREAPPAQAGETPPGGAASAPPPSDSGTRA